MTPAVPLPRSPAISNSGRAEAQDVSGLTSPLLAGGAWADITPDLPVRRGGGVGGQEGIYINEVHSPITAQSVAWGDGDQCVIWTSCDVGSVQDDFVAGLRQIVSKRTGVSPHQIYVSATHGHGAPTSPKFSIYHTEASMAETRATYEAMMKKAAESAIEAYQNRKPARLGYGRGRVERACFNRRFIMSDGRSRMYGGVSEGVERLQVEGPVDDEVQTVWFEDHESGKPLAILVNMASHPNQMYGMKMLGSEYPGQMRKTVCQALGRDIPIVFLQGACGNISTKEIGSNSGWGRGLDCVRIIGNLVAGEIIKLLHSAKAEETEGMVLGQIRASVELAYRDFPCEEIERTLRIIQEGRQSDNVKAYLDKHFTSTEAKARAKQIELIDSLKKQGDTGVLEICGIRLGDLIFITTPAHQFVEFQIALKEAFPGRKVLLADLTNGSANYVPTQLAIALGGYEPEHRLYESTAGEKILATGVALAQRLLDGRPAAKAAPQP